MARWRPHRVVSPLSSAQREKALDYLKTWSLSRYQHAVRLKTTPELDEFLTAVVPEKDPPTGAANKLESESGDYQAKPIWWILPSDKKNFQK
jgi:hypothetical protein